MFPLLFMPFQAGDTGVDQLDNLPLCYDLKCSEEFGVGAMNVSIQEKINIREPVYNVSINTVKVKTSNLSTILSCDSDLTSTNVSLSVCPVSVQTNQYVKLAYISYFSHPCQSSSISS